MDPNRLTQKSQEALHDGIAPRLLSRAGADADRLTAALEAELLRRPHGELTVSYSGEAGPEGGSHAASPV